MNAQLVVFCTGGPGLEALVGYKSHHLDMVIPFGSCE
jgi:hypothetical protein